MKELAKITKISLINFTLSTLFLVLIVSCKDKVPVSSSTEKPVNVQKRESDKPVSNDKIDKVLKEARSYIGTTYKYGGCTRNGIDCSGLTSTAYKAANITLPRTSTEQSTTGKPVKLGDLKPGDLLFFTDKKGNTKVTHVGIVSEIKGDKNVKFIHASTKLGVVEDNLYSEWHISLFLKAVRVV